MRKNMNDGTEELVDRVTDEELRRAMRDYNVKSIEIHKPGSVITHSDGRKYVVSEKGSWVRVDKVRK